MSLEPIKDPLPQVSFDATRKPKAQRIPTRGTAKKPEEVKKPEGTKHNHKDDYKNCVHNLGDTDISVGYG